MDRSEVHDEAVKRIHDETMIIDIHTDIAYDVERQREYGRKRIIENDYLPDLEAGGVNVIVSSIFVDNKDLPEMALRKALNQISAIYADIEESSEKLKLCKRYKDIEQAKHEGKVGVLLSFEGVEPLHKDLSLLKIFYELGVRMMGITWSRRNYAADGALYGPNDHNIGSGLTDFGVSLIQEAVKYGMIIDVSHLNDRGFWDVVNLMDKPFIASHSDCRKLVNIGRNLSDDQIKMIAERNGVTGINAINVIAVNEGEEESMERLADHIDYIVQMVGPAHVGLGLDLNDKLVKYLSPEQLRILPRPVKDIMKGYYELPALTEILLKRGYRESDISMIYGENMARIFREILV